MAWMDSRFFHICTEEVQVGAPRCSWQQLISLFPWSPNRELIFPLTRTNARPGPGSHLTTIVCGNKLSVTWLQISMGQRRVKTAAESLARSCGPTPKRNHRRPPTRPRTGLRIGTALLTWERQHGVHILEGEKGSDRIGSDRSGAGCFVGAHRYRNNTLVLVRLHGPPPPPPFPPPLPPPPPPLPGLHLLSLLRISLFLPPG